MNHSMILKKAALGLVVISTMAMMGTVEAWAAGTEGFTRSHWDLIMRWVNFIILAALIVKYARKPLADFLHHKKDDVTRLIDRYEQQKEDVEAKISESQRLLEESEERLKVIEARIITEGERRKTAAIEAARTASRVMMETAQLKIEGQLREAHGRLKAEIIDSAVQKAMAKMPAVITADDHDRLIHQWLEASQA